jgi:hypothetical protein
MSDALADALSDSDSELEEDIIVRCSVATVSCALWYSLQFDKTPLHTSVLSGQQWLNELLLGHDMRFYNELGMHKFVFNRLLATLETSTGLHGTRHVSTAEQVAVFLHYARRGLSNRALQERFQRSGDTIRKWVGRLVTQVRA